jgi:hypothetical protein
MPKVYATANSPTDEALREAFTNYGIKPPVSADKHGRFYDVEIPKFWNGRRRAAFQSALEQATERAKRNDRRR